MNKNNSSNNDNNNVSQSRMCAQYSATFGVAMKNDRCDAINLASCNVNGWEKELRKQQ